MSIREHCLQLTCALFICRKQSKSNELLRVAVVSYLNDLSKKTGGAPTTIPDDASNEQLTEILNVCFTWLTKVTYKAKGVLKSIP